MDVATRFQDFKIFISQVQLFWFIELAILTLPEMTSCGAVDTKPEFTWERRTAKIMSASPNYLSLI